MFTQEASAISKLNPSENRPEMLNFLMNQEHNMLNFVKLWHFKNVFWSNKRSISRLRQFKYS